jgi:hypothetical protein
VTDPGRPPSISGAFRYYRERYDTFRQFDRPLPDGPARLYRPLAHLFSLGFDKIIAILLRPVIRRFTSNVTGTLALVFSANQSRVAQKLMELEIPLSPISLGSFESAFDSRRRQISDPVLALASLANASRTVRALSESARDPVLSSNSARVVKACGIAFVLEYLLETCNRVILFNDHAPYSVLAHDMAKERGLPTVYVQHAPVNDDFPALYNDLNILFSRAAADMYEARPGAESFRFFDLRMLDCRTCDLGGAHDRPVLICTNAIDELARISELVGRLLDEGHEVILRPHPREPRRWQELPSRVEISRTGTIWEDLERAGPVLANESAVALDAIFKGKFFYKCGFLSPSYDNYRFLREGLITEDYQSIDRLLADLRQEKRRYDVTKLDYFIGPMSEWRERRDRLRERLK